MNYGCVVKRGMRLKGNGRLWENIFSMVTLRGMEYILSFLLVPYLLRTLGPANYGAIAFMQGIAAYYNLFIDFGFNLTAPRKLARSSAGETPYIFSTFMWAKVLLLVCVTFVFGIILWGADRAGIVSVDTYLFTAVYTAVIGNVLFPVWFFQGIQEMRYITIINLLGRLFCILGIFALVSSEDDYILAAFLQSCTPFIAGILSLVLISRRYHGMWRCPDFQKIKSAFKEAKQIFISNLAISLYTNTDIVVLGILTNDTVVGYYSGADKLLNCIKRGVSAVNDAVYPYISKMLTVDRDRAIRFLRKQMAVYVIGGITGGLILLFGAPVFIPWLLGPKYIPSILPLQIMSFVPLIVALSNIFGYETMLPFGMEKVYSRILILASFLNLVIIGPFVWVYQENGVSLAMFITETFVAVVQGLVLHKNKILL